MTTAALIVAAGRGTRAGGGDVPKQWQHVAGRMVAEHTVARFAAHPEVGPIVLVLHPPGDMERAACFPDVICVPGGETRDQSVSEGLNALNGGALIETPPPARVLIHDVARPPCVSDRIISEVIAALDSSPPGAAPLRWP